MKTWTTGKSTIIYQVLKGRINTYLIQHKEGFVLVDSGLNRLSKRLKNTLKKIINNPVNIDYLFLTHAHFDHCQNAAEIAKTYNSRVIINSAEAYNLISGKSAIPAGTMFFFKIIKRIGNSFSNGITEFKPLQPDIILNDSGTIFNVNPLKIIHTPGHSAGSMSIIIDNEIALAGDALFGVFPNHAFPPFADDTEDLVESWGKLLNTGCKLFLPGHGNPVTRSTLEKEFAARSI